MNSTNHQRGLGGRFAWTRRDASGFSLVELVIVLVIIGVIAAIAVPRLSRGASGAGEAALVSDLTALRSAIELYSAEHSSVFPGAAADGMGNAGDSTGAFFNQLTKYSSTKGEVSDTRDVTHRFGPYLRDMPPLPVGANRGSQTVAIDIVSSPPVAAVGSDGWVYNSKTGAIIANSDAANLAGSRAYDEY